MMQASLFVPPTVEVRTPVARRKDPESSHAAAEEVTLSGRRDAQVAQVLAAVRANPGRTSMELARLAGLDRYMVARRLPECVTAGALRKGEQRTCKVSDRLALTWWPA